MEEDSPRNEIALGIQSSVQNEDHLQEEAVTAAPELRNGAGDNSNSPDVEVPLPLTLTEGETQNNGEDQSDEETGSSVERKY